MGRKRRPRRDTAICGHCREEFPAGRPACPHCGSDAETGWSEDAQVDWGWAAVPEEFDEDDYQSVLRDLPGGHAPPEARFLSQRQFVNLVIGLLVVAALVFVFVV